MRRSVAAFLLTTAALACAPGSLSPASQDESESGMETEDGGDPVCELHAAEIELVLEELLLIADGAIQWFSESHPDEYHASHRCPHPDGFPLGGNAGTTPDLAFDCNDGPNGQCVPVEGGAGGGYYDIALWEHNTVWAALGFQKSAPHSFHYDFVSDNEGLAADYGTCVFTASAWADLDQDFAFSHYRVVGHLAADSTVITEVHIDDPCE